MAGLPRPGQQLAQWAAPCVEDLDEDDDILDWVQAFISDDTFRINIGLFVEEHASEFADAEVGGEQKLEWTERYNEFLALCEGDLEGFLSGKGWTSERFYQHCREELAAANENHRHSKRSFFLQLLMASSEYEEFIVMMRESAEYEKYLLREALFEAAATLVDGSDDSDDDSDDDSAGDGADRKDSKGSGDGSGDDAKAGRPGRVGAEVLDWLQRHQDAGIAELRERSDEFRRALLRAPAQRAEAKGAGSSPAQRDAKGAKGLADESDDEK